MGEVISIGKLTEEQTVELAEAGVGISERVDLDKMNVPEPQYGEAFVFHVEPDEAAIFVELHETTLTLEKWTRDLFADTMTNMGEKVRQSDLDKPFWEVFQDGEVKPFFEDEAKGEEYFRLQQRRAFLHGLLYWKLGERSGLHGHRLGIRKPMAGEDKLRVVKLDRRW